MYQNGVRINEPFGDTVNWDLIPLSAIGSVQLLAGTNPVFGLNTLGGALSLQMKNGFNYEGTGAEVYGGSFAPAQRLRCRAAATTARWGYYGDIDYFEEDGWRDFSHSDALRFFGALSHRERRLHSRSERRARRARAARQWRFARSSCWSSTARRSSRIRTSPRTS